MRHPPDGDDLPLDHCHVSPAHELAVSHMHDHSHSLRATPYHPHRYLAHRCSRVRQAAVAWCSFQDSKTSLIQSSTLPRSTSLRVAWTRLPPGGRPPHKMVPYHPSDILQAHPPPCNRGLLYQQRNSHQMEPFD